MVSVSRYIVLNFFQKMKILIVISDISKTKKHINPKMKYFYVKNIYVLYKNVNFSQVPIQNIALISIFLSFILFIFHKCYQLQIHSYNTRSMFYFSNAFCKMQNQDNLLKTPTTFIWRKLNGNSFLTCFLDLGKDRPYLISEKVSS